MSAVESTGGEEQEAALAMAATLGVAAAIEVLQMERGEAPEAEEEAQEVAVQAMAVQEVAMAAEEVWRW